jgi:hypothetical protein
MFYDKDKGCSGSQITGGKQFTGHWERLKS